MAKQRAQFGIHSFFILFLLMAGADLMDLRTFKMTCSKLGSIQVHKYSKLVPNPLDSTPFKRFFTTDKKTCALECLRDMTQCKTFLMVKKKMKYECQQFDFSHRAFPGRFVNVSYSAEGREVFCRYQGEFFQQTGKWDASSRERSSSYAILQTREKLGLITVDKILKSEPVEDNAHCLVLSSNWAKRGTIFVHLKIDETENKTMCNIFEQSH